VNSELRIGNLGHFSAGRGMYAIVYIRMPQNEPQGVGRRRPQLANRQSAIANPDCPSPRNRSINSSRSSPRFGTSTNKQNIQPLRALVSPGRSATSSSSLRTSSFGLRTSDFTCGPRKAICLLTPGVMHLPSAGRSPAREKDKQPAENSQEGGQISVAHETESTLK